MSRIIKPHYRKPTNIFSRTLEGVSLILKLRINDAMEAIQRDLLKAATAITQQLGTQPTGGATQRIGLPEAICLLLERCGDHTAARLACETFLASHPADPDAAPTFGEYRDFVIEPNTATGDGWIVLDGARNMMPNGESFESVEKARAAVDLLYEHGLRITADFMEEVAALTTKTS